MLVSHTGGEPLSYSVLRSVQTVIGVLVAWLINVITTAKYDKKIHRCFKSVDFFKK